MTQPYEVTAKLPGSEQQNGPIEQPNYDRSLTATARLVPHDEEEGEE